MMSAVKAAIKALNARATARPTATTTMSPRMRKFLNPLSTVTPPWPFPGWEHWYRSGPDRPWNDDDIALDQARYRNTLGGTHLPSGAAGQAWLSRGGAGLDTVAHRTASGGWPFMLGGDAASGARGRECDE